MTGNLADMQGFVESRNSGSSCAQTTQILRQTSKPHSVLQMDNVIWQGDCLTFLKGLPNEPIFDFLVTLPPYNIGKSYETRVSLDKYLEWQEKILDEAIPRLKPGGSICWQVGNFVAGGEIFPLDIEFAPIFKRHQLQLRNRIV